MLRHGGFYGPGTSISADGEHLAAIRKRRFPIIGDGGAKAKRELGWQPRHPSWREGFAELARGS